MEKIIFEIKNQIFETICLTQEYFKKLNLVPILLALVLFYIIFLRKWEFKKTISFLFIVFILFIVLVRTEDFLFSTFGAEGSFFSIDVARIVFLFISAIVFIYNATIKE